MKAISYLLAAVLATCSLFAGSLLAQTPNGPALKADESEAAAARVITQDPALQRTIDDTLYKVRPTRSGGFRADNAAQHLSTEFFGSSAAVATHSETLELRLLGHGLPAATSTDGKRIERTYEGLREWFVNGAAGLEQGFVVDEKTAEFRIRVAVGRGWAVSSESDGLAFSKDNDKFEYAGLKAWDANGTQLHAQMHPVAGGFEIQVDDARAVYPVTVDPILTFQSYLTDSRGLGFGNSVAVSEDGNIALVGSPYTTVGSNTEEGAAFVFIRSGGTWTEQAEITEPTSGANAGGPNDIFGTSVALSANGGVALIGAPEHNSFAGGAFIFYRSGSTWTLITALPTQGSSSFGSFVSLSQDGKTAMSIGGAPVAYLFSQPSSWALEATLAPAGASGRCSASMSGDASTVIIRANSMYFYTGSGTSWGTPQVFPGPRYGYGGNSVSLSSNGNIALIGGAEDGVNIGDNTGDAFIYQRSAGVWTQTALLTAPSSGVGAAALGDFFGYSVTLSPDGLVALIGAPYKTVGSNIHQGMAYEFSGGKSWTMQQVLVAPVNGTDAGAANDLFGAAVAVAPNRAAALVGAISKNGTVGQQGAVYAYYSVNITITANFFGLPFTVTGTDCAPGSYATPVTLQWTPNAACTVTFTTPAPGGTGTQYVFVTWDNASTDPSRFIVAPATSTTYVATFKTQYLLTTAATPVTAGNITPVSGYFDAGSSITVTAPAKAGYSFMDFTGALTGTANPQTLILNAPSTVTAQYKKGLR